MLHLVPAPLRKYIDREEKLWAILTSWILAPFCFTLFGFYFGTIASDPDHVKDLQEHNLVLALNYALVGLIVGVAVAVFVTLWYPRQVDSEPEELHEHPSEVYDSVDMSVRPDPGV